jgi:hypothetical protein
MAQTRLDGTTISDDFDAAASQLKAKFGDKTRDVGTLSPQT